MKYENNPVNISTFASRNFTSERLSPLWNRACFQETSELQTGPKFASQSVLLSHFIGDFRYFVLDLWRLAAGLRSSTEILIFCLSFFKILLCFLGDAFTFNDVSEW